MEQAAPTKARTRMQRVETRGSFYGILAVLVVAGILTVVVMGILGAVSPGLLSVRGGFFVVGAALVVIAAGVVVLLLSMRRTIALLRGQQTEIDRQQDAQLRLLDEMQVQRDAMQDAEARERARGQDLRDTAQEMMMRMFVAEQGKRDKAQDERIERLVHASEERAVALVRREIADVRATAVALVSKGGGADPGAVERLLAEQAARDAAQDERVERLVAGAEERVGTALSREVASLRAGLDALQADLHGERLSQRVQRVVDEHEGGAVTGAASASAAPLPRRKGSTARATPFGQINAVIDVEGIGPKQSERLKALGIHDTEQLWSADPDVVARHVGVHRTVVEQWQIMAELMAIKRIGGQYAELLMRSGVRGLADLAGDEPEALLQRIEDKQEGRFRRIQGNPVTRETVQSWIDLAKEHEPVGLRGKV